MTYGEVVHAAFLDELQKIAAAGGLTKVALSFAPMVGMAKKLVGATSAPAAAAKASFRGGPGIFQRYGNDLMAGGKMLGRDATASLRAGVPVAAGPGRRMLGEVAQGMGHHYAHKSTLSNMITPLGGALGGIAEGAARAGGKELSRAGARPGMPAAVSRVLGGAGTGLQRAAKPLGAVGEVTGLAGLGTAMHAPLSLAGAVGGKLVGAASLGAPLVGDALHSAGGTVAHAAHDVLGNIAHSSVDKTRRAAGMVKAPIKAPVTGYSLMPPPMAGVAT